ncbi:MAG: cysteine desulfurase family protein [Campylobacterota bacterium]|nr:cysteine desulfurase family protein [Campylobacterota bacterium]
MQVYLDNNTTTMVDPQVKEAMEPFFSELYGDPNALHHNASELKQPLQDAMERIYATLNASHDDSVVITSGASESNNWVVMSTYFEQILSGEKNHILLSEVESPSIIKAAKFLESKGARITLLPVNSEGIIQAHTLKDFITPKTALVSINWVNGESGAIFPIEHIAYFCEQKGVPFHTDATHAMGKIPMSLKDNAIDYLSFDAHLFHGPKGIGGLYMRKGKELNPMLHGSNEMDGLRAGMLNVPAIVGMGKAMELAFDAMDFELEDAKELLEEFEEALLEIEGVKILSPNNKRVANTLWVSFDGIDSEALLWDLSQAGIAASKGSSDASSIIFALSRFSTQEEMEYTLEEVKKGVVRLRAISGTYAK